MKFATASFGSGNRAAILLLILALVAGIGFRVHELARAPLSFDEAASVYIARMPLSAALEKNGAFNSSPPFMLVLLHLILKVGQTEEFVRGASVATGILTIGLVFHIGTYLHPSRYTSGAIAAFLFALSKDQITISRQFRVYALGELFGALAIAAVFAYAHRPTWFRASAVASQFFIGIQVQYALAPFFLALGLALVAHSIPAKSWRVTLPHIFAIAGAALAGALVTYETALKYQLYIGRGSSYSPTLSASSDTLLVFLVQSWSLIAAGLSIDGLSWSGALLAFCSVGGAWYLIRRSARDLFLVATTCSFVIFGLLSAASYYPYGPVRQCLILTLPVYGLAAVGVTQILSYVPATARAALAVPIVVGLVLITGAFIYAGNHREPGLTATRDGDFREGLRLIRAQSRPGDIIFVAPGSFPIFDYYSRRSESPAWVAAQGSIEWMQDERAWRHMTGTEPPYAPQLDTLLKSHARVWMIYSHYHPGEMKLPQLAARRAWTKHVQSILQGRGVEAGEGLELYLYSAST